MFNSLTRSHTKQSSSRKIKSTGYTRRKNKKHPNLIEQPKLIEHPNLIGNFTHLFDSYKVYLFNTLTPEIIRATARVCEPDFSSEYLPDILSEEGNLIFLLVKNKYVIGFIIANNDYCNTSCTEPLDNTSYIKLLCLKKNKRKSGLFPAFIQFVENYLHNTFNITHIRLTANNRTNFLKYMKIGFIQENYTNYDCEYSMIKHLE